MKYLYLLLIAVLPLTNQAQNLSKNAQKAVDLLESGGDPESALAILKKEVKKDPKNGKLHYYIGFTQSIINPYEGLDEFNKAIELDTTIADAYAQRALLQEDNDAALRDLDKAISLDPENFGYYFNRAGARLEAKDYEGTIADVDKSYALMPGVLQDIFVTKADALSHLGRHEDALLELQKIETNMHMEYYFQYVYGEIKLRQNDLENACDHFQRAKIIIGEYTDTLPENLVDYLKNCK